MISADKQIIGRLPGRHVIIAARKDSEDPGSEKNQAIEKLKNRDREVRAHESSHSTDPNLIKIGSARFDYTIGPDGKAYATGGRVTLSTGNAKTPEEALSKAEALKKASMAPGEPSSMDFQALNAGKAMETEAMNQLYSRNKTLNEKGVSTMKGMSLNLYA